MLRRTAGRAVLLAALVSPFLLTGAPPASASIFSQSSFQGTITLSAGINYPCAPPTTFNTQKCPFPVPPKAPPWGNVRSFAISSTVCAGTDNDFFKFGVSVTARAGTCTFFAAGSMKLDCIIGDGLGTASLSYTPLIGPPVTRVFTFAIRHVNGVWSLLAAGPTVVDGTLVGAPVPSFPSGNRCLDKTATTITFWGGMTVMTLNT